MTETTLKEFEHSDEDYLEWITNHSEGYVLNTTRAHTSFYFVLHKATCPTINNYEGNAKPGGFTEREYIKICCDNLDEIKNWVRSKGVSSNSITQDCYCWEDDWW